MLLLLPALELSACDRSPPDPAKPEARSAHARARDPRAKAAPPLPAIERARLQYLREAGRLLAQSWPWMMHEDPCVLLLSETTQWVVTCADPPAGFERSVGDFGGQAVYSREHATFMNGGRELTTSELLSRMAASAYVDEVGAQRTDLSPKKPWLVLGSLSALRRFHPAFEQATTEAWVSVALHELMHAHMLRQEAFVPTLRRINDHSLEPRPLIDLYSTDPKYRALVDHEYAQLIAALWQEGLNATSARTALADWHALYRERCAYLEARDAGHTLLEADRVFTYIEGTARYVESVFLVEPAQHPAQAIRGDPNFTGFARWKEGGYAAMENRQLDKEYYYAIGFHLALLLDHVEPRWKARVVSQPGFLVGLVESTLQPAPEP